MTAKIHCFSLAKQEMVLRDLNQALTRVKEEDMYPRMLGSWKTSDRAV